MSSARRGQTPIRPGYVYVVTNPAWPGKSKVGSTIRLSRRMTTYNTGSPKRDYCLYGYVRTPNPTRLETVAHTRMAGFRIPGTEWFHLAAPEVLQILNQLTREEINEHG